MDIPILHTERLVLRGYRPGEFDFYASVVGDAEVMRYLDGPLARPLAFRSFCSVFGHWQVRGHGMWALEEKATGKLLGHAGLPRWEGSAGLEIGYALHRDAWKRGFAVEACLEVRRWAREALSARGLVSVIHPDNAASIRVAEKMGAVWRRDFDHRGTALRVYLHPDG